MFFGFPCLANQQGCAGAECGQAHQRICGGGLVGVLQGVGQLRKFLSSAFLAERGTGKGPCRRPGRADAHERGEDEGCLACRL